MINRRKKAFLSLLLASALSVQSSYSNAIIIEEKKLEKLSKEEEEKQKILEKALEYYDNFEPEYSDYEDNIITEEETRKIIEDSDYKQECTFKFDYDVEKLIETIKENSKEYLQTHPEFSSAFQEEENLDDLFLVQKNFERIFREAIEKIIEKNTNNLNEDFHRMQSLKVVFDETECLEENETNEYKIVRDLNSYSILGYYIPYENVMVINYETIKISIEKEIGIIEIKGRLNMIHLNDRIIERMYYTISHELNHVRQTPCDCRNSERLLNPFEKALVDTIMESSAESEIYNLQKEIRENRDINEYCYPQKRNQEAMLLLIAMTNGKTNIEDYYNAIYDTDFKAFLDFFGIDDEEDTQRFLKILNSIKNVEENGEDISYAYRNEILAMCLYNLVEYTKKNKNFSLLDNVMLFNIVKNTICMSESPYPFYINIKNDDSTFVEQFEYLEEKYVKFLSEYYMVSEAEIRELEDSIYEYGHTIITLIKNELSYDWGYLENSEHLLRKFPLLKPILCIESYYEENAKELIRYYGKKLILEKE